MTEKITYYAIIDEFSSRDHPAGVLRRVENDEGEIDEVFSRNLRWEFSPLLYSAERGDLEQVLADRPHWLAGAFYSMYHRGRSGHRLWFGRTLWRLLRARGIFRGHGHEGISSEL